MSENICQNKLQCCIMATDECNGRLYLKKNLLVLLSFSVFDESMYALTIRLLWTCVWGPRYLRNSTWIEQKWVETLIHLMTCHRWRLLPQVNKCRNAVHFRNNIIFWCSDVPSRCFPYKALTLVCPSPRSLLEATTASLRRMGYTSVELLTHHTNTSALNFYKKRGFRLFNVIHYASVYPYVYEQHELVLHFE